VALHERVPAEQRTQVGAGPAPVGRAALLYDRECPFCRWSAGVLLAWDRDGRLLPVPIQGPDGATLLPELTPDARLESFHLVAPAGARYSGGPAFVPLFELLPRGRRLARLAARFERATNRGYDLVSKYRAQLLKLIPGPVVRWGENHLESRLRDDVPEEELVQPTPVGPGL
jgi:predicted DCC family thiol-disulfide oxidoreductase YuxK